MKEIVFEVRNLVYTVESILSIEMDTIEHTLLEEINFQLYKNEIVGIVGENGAGKSTLCKLLAGIDVPTKGEILLESQNILEYSPQWKIHRDIAMVFQNIDEQFIGTSCREDAFLYLANFGFSEEEIELRLSDIAKELQVDALLDSPLSELSGGQKQLLAIVEVLALKPKVLILDEPTAQLDEINEAIVLKQLEKIVAKKQVSIILVSHKMSELKHSDRILGLADKTIEHDLSTDRFLTAHELLDNYHLNISPILEITHYLQKNNVPLPSLTDLSVPTFMHNIQSIFKEDQKE
ncbi:energy-coupling factor transporter ATP-binding protein EcfA1 [Tetragenococcus halophilus subsp. flandriensis]|uniref:energy-coupling factor ABC transporter ATP-binding protein n=1 Tax=Tetragenococcus halophilus TaxID=51669 RepID=UPI0023E98A04|nr:ABC transporter ATP-binding protein [Tetragenococcus halophilus]GMA08144.1 energy-coupling factor transporter ATP-binding protein EcfA1 [Tetragenococcus halophilus subsp. flandriensis]